MLITFMLHVQNTSRHYCNIIRGGTKLLHAEGVGLSNSNEMKTCERTASRLQRKYVRFFYDLTNSCAIHKIRRLFIYH